MLHGSARRPLQGAALKGLGRAGGTESHAGVQAWDAQPARRRCHRGFHRRLQIVIAVAARYQRRRRGNRRLRAAAALSAEVHSPRPRRACPPTATWAARVHEPLQLSGAVDYILRAPISRRRSSRCRAEEPAGEGRSPTRTVRRTAPVASRLADQQQRGSTSDRRYARAQEWVRDRPDLLSVLSRCCRVSERVSPYPYGPKRRQRRPTCVLQREQEVHTTHTNTDAHAANSHFHPSSD